MPRGIVHSCFEPMRLGTDVTRPWKARTRKAPVDDRRRISCLSSVRYRCRCRHAEDPATAHWNRDKLFATKTIFYVSYSINFILYSLAGANYRNAVAALCRPCCRTGGRFQPAASRRTTPGAARRLSGSTLGPSSDSGSAAACAAIVMETRRVAVSAV